MKRKVVAFAIIVAVGVCCAGLTVPAQAQEHPERAKFHADVAHALLEMNTTLDLIEAYRAQGTMPPDRDARHEKAAHGFRHALELFGVKVAMPEHADRVKFHADVAHALLEMNTTLDLIEAYRAQDAMPPDRDAKHEKAAHGFRHGLELFGVKVAMPEHKDPASFHADIAHALLDMNTTLDLIEAYRGEGAMPPDRDEKHEKAAHGFLKGLQLFGVQTSMPATPRK
jgi:DNA-binding cell septation regulator SpoVG